MADISGVSHTHPHGACRAGWIHGVHTPQDSLVFGGNFLHMHALKEQLAYVVEC